MFKLSDFKKESYRIGEVARLLGITPQTLRKYADKGVLKTWRASDNGNRRVNRNDLIDFVKTLGIYEDESSKVNVVYFSNDVDPKTQCDIVIRHMDDIQGYVILNNSSYTVSARTLTDLADVGAIDKVFICNVKIPLIEYATIKAICETYHIELVEID